MCVSASTTLSQVFPFCFTLRCSQSSADACQCCARVKGEGNSLCQITKEGGVTCTEFREVRIDRMVRNF